MSSYITFDTATTQTAGFTVYGTAAIGGEYTPVSGEVKVEGGGIHPVLAFKYIKKKFGILERITLDRRLKRLESAFNVAVDNGQEALGDKILKEIARETRESALYAKGIRHFVEKEAIQKVKYKIKEGHISDTKLEDYTKHIPKNVIAKKKEYDGFFDGFVVYHYYNKKNEDKIAKNQKMDEKEKSKMRDPILFGYIRETDRLYFVADWEDEHCDLTFDELIGVVADQKLIKIPDLKITLPAK